jgi:imidazolonepropionase-like amidohydrolase
MQIGELGLRNSGLEERAWAAGANNGRQQRASNDGVNFGMRTTGGNSGRERRGEEFEAEIEFESQLPFPSKRSERRPLPGPQRARRRGPSARQPRRALRAGAPAASALATLALLALLPAAVAHAQSPPPPRVVAVTDGAADPAVSPDGRRIAVSILGRLWLVPVVGGEAEQVTDGLGWDGAPAWSPDGTLLAYAHASPSGSDLVVRDLATGTSTIVRHEDGTIPEIQYSPDGARLYYIRQTGQYDAHLWRVDVDGDSARQLTFTHGWHEWSFALAPDGRNALLTSGHYGGSDLFLLDLDSLTSTPLEPTPGANESAVAWSADGRTQVFVRTVDGVDHVMARAAGPGPAAGAGSLGSGSSGAGTAAGERVLFSSAFDQKQLALVPDGKAAVLCAGRELYRLDVATGATSPIRFTARFHLPARAPADLVITHARLWTGTGAAVVEDATVVVRDGRIVAAGPASATSPPAGVPVMDAGGRTLLPGLMDNHYHFWSPAQGPPLLAAGITTIRDPGAPISTSLNYREAIALGLEAGPHIYTAGPLIDGVGGYHPWVDVELADSTAAPALVDALEAQGVDLLKVYFMLEPPVLRAVIREAHRVGLPVTGHIGVRTGLRTAMEGGIDGLNHVRIWRDLPPDHAQPDGSNESLDGEVHAVERMQADWTGIDPDGDAARSLIQLMAKTRIGFDPTLNIQRITPEMRQQLGLDAYRRAQQSFRLMGRFVHNAFEAGVPLLAGTDDGSLDDEMQIYQDNGIPDDAILRAATVNGAEWLHHAGDFGTIQPGRRADLLIVDGDPLQDVKALRAVWVVVQDGRVVFRK